MPCFLWAKVTPQDHCEGTKAVIFVLWMKLYSVLYVSCLIESSELYHMLGNCDTILEMGGDTITQYFLNELLAKVAR